MAPDAKKRALLYVSDSSTYDVYVFTFPRGKLVGTLTNQNNPAGLCTDKKGDDLSAADERRLVLGQHAGL
jgi:hypothetical protein